MASDALQDKQQSLIRELDAVFDLLELNYHQVRSWERESRTTRPRLALDHAIRGAVIRQYTLIDEHLSNVLCDYFFGRKKSHIQLWRTKKFRNFNYYVLQELSLLKKLSFVRAIRKLPKAVRATVERVNDLRNGLAHAFFPENLRKSKPVYRGESIFTLKGITLFLEDMSEAHNFFVGVKVKQATTPSSPHAEEIRRSG